MMGREAAGAGSFQVRIASKAVRERAAMPRFLQLTGRRIVLMLVVLGIAASVGASWLLSRDPFPGVELPEEFPFDPHESTLQSSLARCEGVCVAELDRRGE